MLWEFVLKWGKRLGQADEGQVKAASRFSKVGPIVCSRVGSEPAAPSGLCAYADILTKALSPSNFEAFRAKLTLCDPSNSSQSHPP